MPDRPIRRPGQDILSVAVVGAGYFARFHYDAWSRISDCRLVATADREIDKARRMAAAHEIPDVFADAIEMIDCVRPDILDIAVQPASHLPLIEAAASRGIRIICQKPFCGTFAEAERAVRIAAAANVPLVVHENFRFQPWHREARRIVEQGVLGDLYGVSFRLRPGDGQGPRAYLDRQPYFQTMERFLVHETAIHLIDVFRSLLGEVASVYADLRRLNPVIKGEDAGIIVLEHVGGARSLFDGNRLVDHKAKDRRLTIGEMLIEGSAGTLRLSGDGDLVMRSFGSNVETVIAYPREHRGFAGDCVFHTQSAAIDGFLGRAPLINSGADYLANLRVEEAVYESSRSGVRIRLDAPSGTAP